MANSKFKVKTKLQPKIVLKAGQDAAEAVGKRFGAYVMTTARSSIRKRKKPSPPGSPPGNRSGTLKKNIVFAYEKDSRTVLIGPRLLPAKTERAPSVLELGGSAPRQIRIGGKKTRRNVLYKARPFMAPALEKRLPELPKLWQNVIK